MKRVILSSTETTSLSIEDVYQKLRSSRKPGQVSNDYTRFSTGNNRGVIFGELGDANYVVYTKSYKDTTTNEWITELVSYDVISDIELDRLRGRFSI